MSNKLNTMLKRLERSGVIYSPIDLSYVGQEETFLFPEYNLIISSHCYSRLKHRTIWGPNPFKFLSEISAAIKNGVLIDEYNYSELYFLLRGKCTEEEKKINLRYYIYNNLKLYVEVLPEGYFLRTVTPFSVLDTHTKSNRLFIDKIRSVFSECNFSTGEINIMFSEDYTKHVNEKSRTLVRDVL